MEKLTKEPSKQFVKYFFGSAIIILFLIALSTYIIDPFFQYRTKDNQYILNPLYANPGLAKNYDYNTVIIGSSMTQNYDLSILKKDSLVKPVKLASGAMTISEMTLMHSLVDKEKVNTFIFNLDIIQFNEWQTLMKYPEYLTEEALLNRLQYLFAYESTVRYGLTDVVLAPYMALTEKEERPLKLRLRTEIDDIGNFSQDAIYNNSERVKNLYLSGKTVTFPFLIDFNSRIKENINLFIKALDPEANKDKEYIFVLPPYSALYWHVTKRDKYFYDLMNNIRYLCEVTAKYNNVRIQFFYDLEEITDMNRYSDVTHFDPEISKFILENLYNNEYRINSENANEKLKQFDKRVIEFRNENIDWI